VGEGGWSQSGCVDDDMMVTAMDDMAEDGWMTNMTVDTQVMQCRWHLSCLQPVSCITIGTCALDESHIDKDFSRAVTALQQLTAPAVASKYICTKLGGKMPQSLAAGDTPELPQHWTEAGAAGTGTGHTLISPSS